MNKTVRDYLMTSMVLSNKPKKGDVRKDGKRYDGHTWRETGLNHHMNNKGLVFYKREYRTLRGYINQGGDASKIKYSAKDVADINKVSELLYNQEGLGGYIYLITNPAWEGWIKIGKAVNPNDRCLSYQTSSPFRDYKLEMAIPVHDRSLSETKAHKEANKLSADRKGEWFKLSIEDAKNLLLKINHLYGEWDFTPKKDIKC